jgi:amino-acid N-acetyltransferase
MIEIFGNNHLQQYKSLLRESGLPHNDLSDIDWFRLLGVLRQTKLVSAAGLERCDQSLLLRSVVTHPKYRGQGLSPQIVFALHQAAYEAGHQEIWLLTTDASDYFIQHHNYVSVDRAEVPRGIETSAEFSMQCPADAVLMRKLLVPMPRRGREKNLRSRA